MLALEKNGPQAIGRSRGGLTTKIHALVDAMGNPVELMLTSGQDHDLTCAEPLIENADPDDLPADFRTIDKLRDWLPIRREQCGKVVFRKSRW